MVVDSKPPPEREAKLMARNYTYEVFLRNPKNGKQTRRLINATNWQNAAERFADGPWQVITVSKRIATAISPFSTERPILRAL
jgi:hypothetical protein